MVSLISFQVAYCSLHTLGRCLLSLKQTFYPSRLALSVLIGSSNPRSRAKVYPSHATWKPLVGNARN